MLVRSLFVAGVHEIGHALGLRHSDVSGSIMEVVYADRKSKSVLAENDISAIRELYGMCFCSYWSTLRISR